MKYIIYQITCLINNKIYIGKHQTKNINDAYFGSGKILKFAQRKYGLENFKKEILYVFETEDEMNAKEKELVTEEFCSRANTYNLCIGGVGGGFSYINNNKLNGFFNKEIAQKGRQTTDAYLEQKYGSFWRSHLANLGTQGLKRKLLEDPDFLKGRTGTFLNRTHTESTKLKMRESHKDKHTGIKNSQFGSMWITNGIENKKIKSTDIIPNEWYRGRM